VFRASRVFAILANRRAHPFHHDEVIGKMDLKEGMPSPHRANYEQFVEIEGKRYTHIINPRTGLRWKAWRVVRLWIFSGRGGCAFDGLFVLGVEAGARVVSSQTTAWLYSFPITQPMEVLVTPGMNTVFCPPWCAAQSAERVALMPACGMRRSKPARVMYLNISGDAFRNRSARARAAARSGALCRALKKV